MNAGEDLTMLPWVMSADADDDRAIYANLGHAELADLSDQAGYDGVRIVGRSTYTIGWPQSLAMYGIEAPVVGQPRLCSTTVNAGALDFSMSAGAATAIDTLEACDRSLDAKAESLGRARLDLDRVHSAIDAWSAQPRSAPDCATDTAVNPAYARLRAVDDMLATATNATVRAYRALLDLRTITSTAAGGTLSETALDRAQSTVDLRLAAYDAILANALADGEGLLVGADEWTVTMPATVRTHGIPSFDIALEDLRADTLGLGGLSVGSADEANAALNDIDLALSQVWMDAERFDVAQRRVARAMNELDEICPG